MESSKDKEAAEAAVLAGQPQRVLFAKTPKPEMVIGVVTDSEPSSLALLAAGVAGLRARQARRQRAK